MADIFLSFSHEDQVAAKSMSRFIETIFGDKPFCSSDRSVLLAGEDWVARIKAELKMAKVLISILTPESVERPWINFEAGAASMGETKIVPVCFGGLTKEGLSKPFFSSLNAIDLRFASDSYYLADSIANHLGKERPEWRDFKDQQDPLGRPYRKLANAIKDLYPPAPSLVA